MGWGGEPTFTLQKHVVLQAQHKKFIRKTRSEHEDPYCLNF